MVQNITNYTFNASSKQVTLTGITANVEKLRLIKNLTTNTYIYKFTDALNISVGGSVITFTGSNASMADTDDLLIQYDLDTSLDTQNVSTGLSQPLTDAQIRASALPISGTVTANNMSYNGATWDRNYNNIESTLLASASRTTTQTSADITVFNAKKLIVVLDMTVVGTGSVTISIDGKDTASGKYYNILTGVPVATNSTNRYRIGENLAAIANAVAQDYLPRVIRIVVTANNANAATYSVGYVLGL